MSAPVKVQIFGQVYSIQGELDGKYVQKLAKYVDEKMHDIADVTKTVDTQKVAVLAALAIADELHSMQRDRGDHEELLRAVTYKRHEFHYRPQTRKGICSGWSWTSPILMRVASFLPFISSIRHLQAAAGTEE